VKAKLTTSLLVLSGLALAPALTSARAQQNDTDDKSASVRTLTGCLSGGEKTGEYTLLAEDGSTWEIHSKAVKLAEHVGHTVTVTGRVWHADLHGAKEKTKGAVNPGANEHGHLRVSAVSMVSDSCKR
jgi:hypothetical protein